MSDQAAFAVPKDRQDVVVLLDSGKSLEGVIFLEYSPVELTVHHKIAALLEADKKFFPLMLKDNGETEFINKKNVKMIELVYGADREKVNVALSLMHVENIRIIFTDDSSVTGALMAEVPAEKARLSDCLNLPDKFLHLKVNGSICYINKDTIRKVVYDRKM